jgi:platelet-activating factor acetylhydrolase
MTDESILRTELVDELPNEHRPDDEWIAARLRVDHEFRKRIAASVQRKIKRNFQGGMGTGYTTSDEVWSHFKPTEEQLERWINQEGRGENRIDEQAAMKGDRGDTTDGTVDSSGESSESTGDGEMRPLSNADEEHWIDDSERRTSPRGEGTTPQRQQEASSGVLEDEKHGNATGHKHTNVSAATAGDTSNDAPPDTWLGMLPALRDGPQQQ